MSVTKFIYLQHLSSQMIGLGWDLVSDRFEGKPPHPYPRLNFTNIIATKHPGVTRRLVLACHYDSKVRRVLSFLYLQNPDIHFAYIIPRHVSSLAFLLCFLCV